MVQEQHQAPAVPATGDAGGIPGAFCVYRAVCAYTRISTRVQECYQPVLLYACNSADEHPADMRMDCILSNAADEQSKPLLPMGADMPREHTGRGYGDTGIVYGDL